MRVARRAIETLGEPVSLDDGQTVIVGASAGVAVFPESEAIETLAALFDRADRALYASKENGRGRVTLDAAPPAGQGHGAGAAEQD